jgi:hypothetical protein
MVTTDWAAKLIGLDETFHGASGVGGGILLVRLASILLAGETLPRPAHIYSAGVRTVHTGIRFRVLLDRHHRRSRTLFEDPSR